MPAPVPLTACDPPRLDWSRPGMPVALDFDDIYFSADGGLAETEAVYLAACGLPDRWQGRQNFVIGELGFGSGLNFLAAWRLWSKTKPLNGHLHFISIEKYPFSGQDLERALGAWPELSDFTERLIEIWPGRVKGAHILQINSNVTLTLLHDDVLVGLKALQGQVDAWFLDGFSPAKNPDMWSEDVIGELGRLSAPDARIGTFTVAGSVREALSRAGFEVTKKDGFGRKRHRLEAVFPEGPAALVSNIDPVIVGAGIAGASLARAFMRRGIVPTLIDPHDGTAASGNKAAIVKPRLDLQDRQESRFFLESYLYALRAYAEDGAVLSKGVFHAAKSDKDIERFKRLGIYQSLPPEQMCFAIGPKGLPGLNFPEALVIDPIKTCQLFRSGAKFILGKAVNVEQHSGKTFVKDADGHTLGSGSHVFVAAGAGISSLGLEANFPLRYSRGQVTTTARVDVDGVLTYGGYAIPLGDYALLGASHARLTDIDPYAVTKSDDVENIEKFKAVTGVIAEPLAGGSRASVRVTQSSTLPLLRKNKNIFTLTALGSRGFVFAPLLAEHIVSEVCGEPRTCLPPGIFVSKTY